MSNSWVTVGKIKQHPTETAIKKHPKKSNKIYRPPVIADIDTLCLSKIKLKYPKLHEEISEFKRSKLCSNNYIYSYITGHFFDKSGNVLYKSNFLRKYKHKSLIDNFILNLKIINTIKRINSKNEQKILSCFVDMKKIYTLIENSLNKRGFWRKLVYDGHVYNGQGKALCKTYEYILKEQIYLKTQEVKKLKWEKTCESSKIVIGKKFSDLFIK